MEVELIERIIGVITGLVAVCAGISAVVPDSKLGKAAGVVNAVALNVRRARNRPGDQ